MNEIRVTPEQLHNWYLEATKKLNPDSYNPKAQVEYEFLTNEQQFIDEYIADKINVLFPTTEEIEWLITKCLTREKHQYEIIDEGGKKKTKEYTTRSTLNITKLSQAISKLYTTDTQKGECCKCGESGNSILNCNKIIVNGICARCGKPLNQNER